MDSKYQFGDNVTLGNKYVDLLGTIHTPEDATEYLEACIEHSMRFGNSREEAEKIERSNIGYVTGYFSNAEAACIQSLFNVVHPIFGSVAQLEQLTPEEILQKGIELGSK